MKCHIQTITADALTATRSPTHLLMCWLHSPGLCDRPPGLLTIEPHTLSHIVHVHVPEGGLGTPKKRGVHNSHTKTKQPVKIH